MSKSRLEAFTDAVIAIVMTILVLDLEAPSDISFAALWSMRYSFLIYLISFLSLAVYWNNHHHLFQITKNISGSILWYNVVFILFLSLYPFATSWVDKNLMARIPEITYGIVILGANIAYALLARALVKVNGPDSQVARALKGFRKVKITLCINVAGIIAGIFFPLSVMIMYVVSNMLWIVPEKRIEFILNEDVQNPAKGKRSW